jgi:hypothetical protein
MKNDRINRGWLPESEVDEIKKALIVYDYANRETTLSLDPLFAVLGIEIAELEDVKGILSSVYYLAKKILEDRLEQTDQLFEFCTPNPDGSCCVEHQRMDDCGNWYIARAEKIELVDGELIVRDGRTVCILDQNSVPRFCFVEQ